MGRLRRGIVAALESGCVLTHRGPWVWLQFGHCPLARLSDALDQRWQTGVWTKPEGCEEADSDRAVRAPVFREGLAQA
jgi:hypothetical protein